MTCVSRGLASCIRLYVFPVLVEDIGAWDFFKVVS